MRYRLLFIGLLLMIASVCVSAQIKDSVSVKAEKMPSKGLLFFYRSSERIDRFLLSGLDTNFISLPEHSWRLALTVSTLGINSTVTSYASPDLNVSLLNRTTPSFDLGFYAGYRGFGFGYSWDVLHAYARRLNFSLGSKSIGLDFSLQTSTNINTTLAINKIVAENMGQGFLSIRNAKLHLWYALNAAHYSHQAAVKQSYIQKKTAGSLLLHLSYMSSQIALTDTLPVGAQEQPAISMMMSNMTSMTTRQIAVGIGYGINYTPNQGKVILHLSAAAMLVAYSVNQISYFIPDSIAGELPGEPMFELHPAFPVHVTGNVRAAVSWEINRWVHLNAYATGEHIRFRSAPTEHTNSLSISNWDWRVQVAVGVRVGAGRDRVQRALDACNAHYDFGEQPEPRKNKLPKWINEFFYSPRL